MIGFIRKHRIIFQLVLLGLIVRLIWMFLFNATYDFFNIIALSKSVADTGDLTAGFYVLKKDGFEPQLYGKFYYQVIALWLFLLEKIKILDIDFLFDTKAYYDLTNYLTGLKQWGIPVYQLISIKSLQLFYDSILVFFSL